MALSHRLKIYSGCGNTFVIHEEPYFIPCETDGVISLVSSTRADFGMRIFNRDGSEAEMCGNGLRCLVAYLRDHGRIQTSCTIESRACVHECLVGEEITVSHPLPRILGTRAIEGYEWTWVDSCVPHVVTFVDAFPKEYIEIARRVRHHPDFSPSGVNVNFAILGGFHDIEMRTYERGVEDETQGCGTGAAAVAMIAKGRRRIRFASGQSVTVVQNEGKLWLTGPAQRV